MEKSSKIAELAKALNAFGSQVAAVPEDGANPFFKSKYATLSSIIETVKKPLKDNGLSFSQFPSGENELTTILMHISGEFMQDTVKMAPKDNTPQGQGSAITYMRRYALSAVLGLATEEDDDGNASSGSYPQTAKGDYSTKNFGRTTSRAVLQEQTTAQLLCDQCKAVITPAERGYSTKNYGKALCRKCQGLAFEAADFPTPPTDEQQPFV